jgi:2-dehydropantoate 2-reductase
MKVCIVGAGAVGGLIGARLARAGHAVTVLARGATLAAVNTHGLRVVEVATGSAYAADVDAVADTAGLGHQDLVVVAVKAPALRSVADAVALLLGPDTAVLGAMNGVPWWFFAGAGEVAAAGAIGREPLESVDPRGEIIERVPFAAVVGGVVHWASSCPEPGLVRLGSGNRLLIGEPAGGSSHRVEWLARALNESGFEAAVVPDIRHEVWFKLWGNMTANPVTAMTGATMDRVLADPLVVRFLLACMAEAAAIGRCIGCPIEESGEARLDLARALGPFKTSMLQDAEAGRPTELDALVSAVREIGQRVGVATPSIDTLLGLARLHGRVHRLYPDA